MYAIRSYYVEQGDVLEFAEAPVEQALGLLGPLLVRREAVDHHDQSAVVDLRRADEAVAGVFGVAGLEAVGAGEAVV